MQTLNKTFLLGTLLLLLTSQSLTAQETTPIKSKMAVVGLHIESEPQTVNKQYLEQVSAQIAAADHVDVLTMEAINIKIEDRNIDAQRGNPSQALMELDAELNKAEDLYYENPKAARKQVRQLTFRISKLLRTTGSNSEVWDRYFQSRMLLARCYIDSGRRDDAQYTLRETIRTFGTSREVSRNAGYHPSLVNAYKRAQRALEDEERGALSINSQPSGAVIVLNGQVTEFTTPHEFKDLYPGAYHVRLSTPNYDSLVHYTEIDSIRQSRLSIDLKTENYIIRTNQQLSLRFQRAKGIKKKLVRTATQLGKWLGVDYVVVLGVTGKGKDAKIRSYLVNVVKEASVAYEHVQIPNAQFSVDAAQKTSLAMTKPWHTGGSDSNEIASINPVVGWSLVGAGTISLGVSIVFALKYSDYKSNAENPDWPTECPEIDLNSNSNNGPQCNPQAPAKSPFGQKSRDDSAASANSASTISAVTGVLGALMLGGGIWVLLNSPGQGDAADELGFSLPGGGQLSPIVSRDLTGFNLGFSF